MRKRDILTPFGITLGFMMLMLAILFKGGAEEATAFLDISSLLVVIGGLGASLLINFKTEQIKLAGKVMKEAFHQNDHRLRDLNGMFVRLADRARREGILTLEDEMDYIDDPYIRKGVMLAVDGIEPDVITDIMNAEITAMEERHYQGRAILEKAGEYAPAWGMIGTLVGLVLMLNSLTDPASLGPKMAVALLTTLYGTVMAHLVFIPMASKLRAKTEEEMFIKQIAIEGIIGIQSGQNPRILQEKLNAFLPYDPKRDYETDAEHAGENVHET